METPGSGTVVTQDAGSHRGDLYPGSAEIGVKRTGQEIMWKKWKSWKIVVLFIWFGKVYNMKYEECLNSERRLAIIFNPTHPAIIWVNCKTGGGRTPPKRPREFRTTNGPGWLKYDEFGEVRFPKHWHARNSYPVSPWGERFGARDVHLFSN